MKKPRLYLFLPFVILLLCFSNNASAQNKAAENLVLDDRQQHIVTISSFTAKGNLQPLHKGDVIKYPPGVAHWHGALPDTKLTHIAIGTNAERGAAVWLQKVGNEEYNNFK